ncbi:MAG TPA: hypothetical protein VFS32_02200 [Candidatus Limnocylindrales bacterium]|nr:hypothetical protein [Candidatus Limnocylindrales bacterium]
MHQTSARDAEDHRVALRVLLARWRAAERRVEDTTPGTAEWVRARLEYESARDAYREEMARSWG